MPKQFATPGNRTLFREVLESRSLARCGLLANALWPRLLLLVDDQGRLAGGTSEILTGAFPRQLAAIPYTDLEAALAELEAERMIVRYRVGGDEYLQLRDWWRWNRSMRRMLPSRFPRPSRWRDAVYGIKGQPESYEAFVLAHGEPGPTSSVNRPSRGHENGSRGHEPKADNDRAKDIGAVTKGDNAAVPPRDHAGARAGEPSRVEPEEDPSRARDAAPDARPTRPGGRGARASFFGIDPGDERHGVARLLATRYRYRDVTTAQWATLAEIVDNEFPIGTELGRDRHAAWGFLADLMAELPRGAGDPIEAALAEVNRRIAERKAAADAELEAHRERTANGAGPIASELVERMASGSAGTNGHAARLTREQLIEQFRTYRGQVADDLLEPQLARHGLTIADLEEPVDFGAGEGHE